MDKNLDKIEKKLDKLEELVQDIRELLEKHREYDDDNVVDGTEVQTDFTPPELKSIKMTSNEVEQGEQININYKALDTVKNYFIN